MPENLTAAQRYEAAFDDVMEMYLELKSLDGTTWNQVYGNPHTHGKNPLLVKPSDQDFICDVELSLRSVLPTRLDIETFYAIVTNMGPVDAEAKKKVVQRVGRELLRRGVSPTNEYFTGKEVTLGNKRI